MLEQSPTLLLVDKSIQLATKGTRSIHDTIILDRWMFRSQSIRKTESPQTRLVNDGISFSAFDDIIACIRPKVVLLCWRTLHNKVKPFLLPEYCDPFRSAPIKALKAGYRKPSKMQINDYGAHEYICVNSFHPMLSIYENDKYAYTNKPRELLFIFTFIQAVNTLQERSIEGEGIEELREIAFMESRLLPCEQDVASQELLDRLQQLGL
ncbi:uncharacterized protein EI97DRAFT_64555 [Westerdykella ornata]|uniref:Uncharacterized protein n=1 Tax=Westerdykella ornata TaxID=318751 RepID=A0A6A6JIU4_WESOR|nr:uncharacterized protein EI97DRAFT_64555 [Westerdykella ornata]KAF2275576.1 hypothetical protein EI97DRAFT_64555 [Westerdykella ornata]